jgi:hypothetical protein
MGRKEEKHVYFLSLRKQFYMRASVWIRDIFLREYRVFEVSFVYYYTSPLRSYVDACKTRIVAVYLCIHIYIKRYKHK